MIPFFAINHRISKVNHDLSRVFIACLKLHQMPTGVRLLCKPGAVARKRWTTHPPLISLAQTLVVNGKC